MRRKRVSEHSSGTENTDPVVTKGTAAPKVEHQHEIEYLTWLVSGIEELLTSIVDVVGGWGNFPCADRS